MNSPREPQDLHVVDLVQDVLLGQVDAATAARVHAHLVRCDECAADYAFAFRLRDAAAAPAENEAELIELLDAIEAPSAQITRPLRRVLPMPARWSMSLVAAAAAILLLLRPWSGDDFAAIARLEPLPVRVTRDVPEPHSFAEARQRALMAYAEADYVGAIAYCDSALARQAGHGEMLIYAASAEALLARTQAAAKRLDQLLSDAREAPSILREARWQRAQLALLARDVELARRQLQSLAEESGLRQEDAKVQLAQLDAN